MLDFKTLCIWIFSRGGSAVKNLLLLVSELSTGHWWLFFCYLSIPVFLSLSDMCKWVLWHKGMAYRDIMYMLPGFTFHEGHMDEGTKFGMNFICRLHDFLRCHPRNHRQSHSPEIHWVCWAAGLWLHLHQIVLTFGETGGQWWMPLHTPLAMLWLVVWLNEILLAPHNNTTQCLYTTLPIPPTYT